ncbi:alpha/beta hydrolase fold domain-containing protein [Amnibacterium kyonggiense]|uniref:Acetyl esterase/lipase n=1 Tax=Amnibacterium kyonggiense TaxID=595671 RepID=A0A4R7FPF6_9MICO|nr:alpha/beta hydrolase fold domain-containing protein [Amnibacterium kyonggiense]TDS79621.1 acetyl esterase/lipase [Amnibacterium kyonggiense]
MPGFDDRLDPGLRAPLDAFLAGIPDGYAALPHTRRRAIAEEAAARSTSGDPGRSGVRWEDRVADRNGAPEVPVRVYRPRGAPEPGRERRLILLLHGGGMWAGGIDSEHATALDLSERFGTTVVSVGYRLAPEHPYPAGLEDCFTALRWAQRHAADLGARAEELVVYGGSAGGGLALALTLLCRDRSIDGIAHVMAPYPMLDDRDATASAREFEHLREGLYDGAANRESWRFYLGGGEADALAAPARATDLSGLPPTFIDVGELDVFRDEDVEFALRLARAGVPVELHVYPGAFHASEIVAPDAALSLRMLETRRAVLQRAVLPPSS